MVGSRKAIWSLRLRLHSGLRQRGNASGAVVSQGVALGWYVSRFQRWVEVGWWSFGCPVGLVAAHSCAKCERMNGAPGLTERIAVGSAFSDFQRLSVDIS